MNMNVHINGLLVRIRDIIGFVSWNCMYIYSFIEMLIEPYVCGLYEWLGNRCPFFGDKTEKEETIDIANLLNTLHNEKEEEGEEIGVEGEKEEEEEPVVIASTKDKQE